MSRSRVHPADSFSAAAASGSSTVPPPLERTSSRKKIIEEESGPEGVLVLRLIRARNLVSADANGFSDPYVVARLRGSRLSAWRSPTRWKTLNPEWDVTHEFPGYLTDLASHPLELKIYDYDTFSCAQPSLTCHDRSFALRPCTARLSRVCVVDDPIGTLSVPLAQLLEQRAQRRGRGHMSQLSELRFEDVPLQGVAKGSITFEVSFELKFNFGLLPGTPVHASAAQALRRPPPADASDLERFRDKVLLFLGHRFFLFIAICWLIALCGFGAFCGITFGALYVPFAIVAVRGNTSTAGENWNAIGLRDETLEWWANVCVQILTGLFTYFNVLTLPWRLSILNHMLGSRSDAPGRDFYGRPTEAIWFHIPRRPRVVIISSLIASTLAHAATQTSRVIYPTYELSGTMPGVLICNGTFVLAMLLGIFAGIVQGMEEKRLRKAQPERYPPNLVDHILALRKKGDFSWWQLVCCRFDKLRKSHSEEQTRWLIQKELSRLPQRFSAPSFCSRPSLDSRSSASKAPAVAQRDALPFFGFVPQRSSHGCQILGAGRAAKSDQTSAALAMHSEHGGPRGRPVKHHQVAPAAGAGQTPADQQRVLTRLLAHRRQQSAMARSADGGLSSPGLHPALPPLPHTHRLCLLPLEGKSLEGKSLEGKSLPIGRVQGECRLLQHGSAPPIRGAAVAQVGHQHVASTVPAALPPLHQCTAGASEVAERMLTTAFPTKGQSIGPLVLPAGSSMLGLDLMLNASGECVVTGVIPGSVAASMGVNVGDYLASINGLRTDAMSQAEVAMSLITAAGGASKIRLGFATRPAFD
jgi:hypothetical protein